jgi:hypothetical protein
MKLHVHLWCQWTQQSQEYGSQMEISMHKHEKQLFSHYTKFCQTMSNLLLLFLNYVQAVSLNTEIWGVCCPAPATCKCASDQFEFSLAITCQIHTDQHTMQLESLTSQKKKKLWNSTFMDVHCKVVPPCLHPDEDRPTYKPYVLQTCRISIRTTYTDHNTMLLLLLPSTWILYKNIWLNNNVCSVSGYYNILQTFENCHCCSLNMINVFWCMDNLIYTANASLAVNQCQTFPTCQQNLLTAAPAHTFYSMPQWNWITLWVSYFFWQQYTLYWCVCH